MRRAAMATVAVVLGAAVPAVADEVLEQLDVARDLYLEGELTEAISELEFAIQAIRAQAGDVYAQTFPPAPEGWTADEVESVAGMPGLGGQMSSRTYSGPDGARVEAELMIDSPMLQAFAAMAQNPALMAMQPNTERVRVHRSNAMLTWPGDGTGELTLALGGRVLIRLDGRGLAERDVLVALAEAWDVAALRDAVGF